MGPACRVSYGLIVLYRLTLGQWVGGHCRFYPSCSAYAQDALRSHAFWPAWRLIVGRIAKCHPWHPGGPDPVIK